MHHQTVAVAPPSATGPTASSAPTTVYVFPADWQPQVVPVCPDQVPDQDYYSHITMAWMSFVFGATPCAIIAIILAGHFHSVNEEK